MPTLKSILAPGNNKSVGTRAGLWHFVTVILLFALGIEMLRQFMTGMVFYLRDAQEVSTVKVGGVALLCFLTVFLAPLVARGTGMRGLMQLTAAGLSATRVGIQFVDVPVADFALSIVGVIMFLWAIPASASLASGGVRAGGGAWLLGLLVGMALDTAIKGGFGTVDLAWQANAGADAIAALMAVGLAGSARIASAQNQGPEPRPPGPLGSLPLLALGPFLFLEMLYFQNVGQQAGLTGWEQPGALAGVSASNLLAIALVPLAMGLQSSPARAFLPIALVILVIAMLQEQTGPLAAAIMFVGHPALVFLMASTVRQQAPNARGRRFTTSTVFAGAGMLLFLAGVFLYYAAYDINVGVPQRAIIIGAVALASVLAVPSMVAKPVERPSIVTPWAIRLAALMMLAPIIFTISWTEPESEAGDGLPVRVMAYNIHQGFGTEGGFELEEIARVIESEKPDVIAFQEVSRGWVVDGSVDMLAWLSQRLDMGYAWGPAADSIWGNAVFSRYPIVRWENHEMPNNDDLALERAFLWVEIDVGEDKPLRVIATHFHSGRDEGEHRIPQSKAIIERWDGESRTVLLGDFNGRPGDPEIEMLREAGLLDSFVDAGVPGNGYTSPSDGPSQRIDYVWTSPDLQSTDYSSVESRASDHLPVAATVGGR